ncbi:MAG: S-layer homology domain-containing protein [Candidatus Gracilibacteria bacterium]|nr:S-layer homology domain-containing protein [Candidatus Gracilibacteria bacterium]
MIAAFSMVAILSTLVVSTAFAGSFTDVPETSGYYTAVEALAADGVLDTKSGLFNGTGSLKRAQGAKMAVLATGMVEADFENPVVASFKDVVKPYWGYEPVETAVSLGIVSGYSDLSGKLTGYFGPDDTLTKAHYTKMLVVALGLPLENPAVGSFSDVVKGNWAYTYVETAVAHGLVSGATTTLFGGSTPLTRFAAADMTYKAMNVTPADEDEEEEEDGELEGGSGEVEEYKLLSSPANLRKVGEGEEDVKVMGFSVEADENSDLKIQSLKLDFDKGAVGNRDFHRYATEVAVWYDDEEVARMDADEFNKDNAYAKTVSLDGVIVRSEEIGKLYVTVSAVSNLDSLDVTDTWDLDVTSVRWMDGDGAIISEDPLLAARTFSFESFVTANNVELKAASSTGTPKSQIVAVNSTKETTGVVLMEGTFKAIGSDVTIDAVPFTVYSSTDDIDDVVSVFTLLMDGEEVETKQPSDGTDDNLDTTVTVVEVADCAGLYCTMTFDDLDYLVEAGDTVTYQVVVDVNELDGVTFTEGNGLTVKLTSAGMDAVDAQDSTGEDLTATELTGSSTGKTQYFFENYVDVELVGTPTNTPVVDNADVSTVTMKVKVTAVGDDVFLNAFDTTNVSGTAYPAFVLGLLAGSGNETMADPVFTLSGDYSSENDGTDDYYALREGDSMTFTITTTITQAGGETSTVGVEMTDIYFGTDDTDEDTRAEFNIDWNDILDQFESPLVTLVG